MRITVAKKAWSVSLPNKGHGIAIEMTQMGNSNLFNKSPLKFHL